MQEKGSKKIYSVARKEFFTYFSSPIAFIFIGVFLLVSMFIFFWVERFFSENIVSVRALFRWMPILLVFLAGALTMRMWSEERRMGTIEFLMTVPVRTHHLVLGKFFACLALVAVALLLTIGVPITVSFMGNLDWGPVIGAYLGSLLLAGAYLSIGLFVSSKCENQIVSLIVSAALCFAFYLIGTESIAGLFGGNFSELFRLLGSGSRFESINRGMIDIRDLYYYLSIIGVFLTLNTLSLEKLKWSEGSSTASQRSWRWLSMLLIANFLIGNIWLQKTSIVRADITEGNLYSLSSSTHSLIAQLQEPLLIRGYFSAKTHALLAPLVPQMRDLISEYEIAGRGRIQAEFIDPKLHADLEEEASRKYNIKPVPFQETNRYQTSLVNSYFHVLVQYGDQFQVLSFQDLIEAKPKADRSLDVKLRNPEYDLTRAIKKSMQGFQSTDNLFATLRAPVKFVGYFSEDRKLPKVFTTFRSELQQVLSEISEESGGKFEVEIVDPDAEDGKVGKEIQEKYGFRPQMASLFDPTTFYFYMTIQNAETVYHIQIPENLSKDGARQSIEATLQRLAPGFLKTVGLYVQKQTPPANPMMARFQPPGKQFRFLQQKLEEDYTVELLNLDKGVVPSHVDMLVLAAPKNFTANELFAVDQYLMKGGTIIVATSPYEVKQTQSSISAATYNSGMKAWLTFHGIGFEENLILDPQNENLPIPTKRNVGGFVINEMSMVRYPFFVDVRSSGMNENSPIVSGIPQVTLNWASPLKINAESNKSRMVTELLHSSKDSWVSSNTEIQPNFEIYRELGFPAANVTQASLLAAVVEGEFRSFYSGKESPLILEARQAAEAKKKEEEEKPIDPANEDPVEDEQEPEFSSSVIDKSPSSSRIVIFASSEFLTDQTLQLSASSGTSRYLNSTQLIQNAADWALEDRSLLGIRNRGHFSRTIVQMSDSQKKIWEWVNYILVVLGLGFVLLLIRILRSSGRKRYSQLLSQV